MDNFELAERKYWNNYWNSKSLPVEIRKTKNSLYLNEILNIFDGYLPKNNHLSILEIGGAPGQYLAYMHNNFGYDIHCLDYSDIGCRKTEENFKLLNIQGKVYQEDLFSEFLPLPQFDIVYSLGFVEHFSDLKTAIHKHLNLLKPGGILLVGVPNFLGINHFFLKRLAPELLSKHNLLTMDITNWKSFEDKFNLKPLFRGYVGGFEPRIFKRCENKNILNGILKMVVKILDISFHRHFKILRKYNARYISGYAMGIYKKPSAEPGQAGKIATKAQ